MNLTEDPGGERINHLSHRYFARDYASPRTDRLKMEIEPVRVTGENRKGPDGI